MNSVELPGGPASLVRKMVNSAAGDDLSIYDEIFASSFLLDGQPCSPAAYKAVSRDLTEAFPDRRIGVEELTECGDFACLRWSMSGTHLGILRTSWAGNLEPKQQRIAIWGLETFRVADDKITEIWSCIDRLDYLRQLGYADVR